MIRNPVQYPDSGSSLFESPEISGRAGEAWNEALYILAYRGKCRFRLWKRTGDLGRSDDAKYRRVPRDGAREVVVHRAYLCQLVQKQHEVGRVAQCGR